MVDRSLYLVYLYEPINDLSQLFIYRDGSNVLSCRDR